MMCRKRTHATRHRTRRHSAGMARPGCAALADGDSWGFNGGSWHGQSHKSVDQPLPRWDTLGNRRAGKQRRTGESTPGKGTPSTKSWAPPRVPWSAPRRFMLPSVVTKKEKTAVPSRLAVGALQVLAEPKRLDACACTLIASGIHEPLRQATIEDRQFSPGLQRVSLSLSTAGWLLGRSPMISYPL